MWPHDRPPRSLISRIDLISVRARPVDWCLLDEVEAFDGVRAVLAIPGVGSGGFVEQPDRLVVPNRLGRRPGGRCQLTDLHPASVLTASNSNSPYIIPSSRRATSERREASHGGSKTSLHVDRLDVGQRSDGVAEIESHDVTHAAERRRDRHVDLDVPATAVELFGIDAIDETEFDDVDRDLRVVHRRGCFPDRSMLNGSLLGSRRVAGRR